MLLEKPVTVAGFPLSFRTPVFEPGRYVVTCVPARDTDNSIQNWTLKQLGDERFISLLRTTLPDSPCTYYAPTVEAMSGVVLPRNEFSILYGLDEVRRIRRPGHISEKVRARCDGTCIAPGDGFIMSAGGCPIVVLNGTGEVGEVCIAAHAGRDSLIDRHFLNKGHPSRTYGSVIEAMVRYAEKHLNAKPEHLILRSFFSLPYQAFPHPLVDPVHGSANQALFHFLKSRGQERALISIDGVQYLSLSVLIQLEANRLKVNHIESGHLNLPENGSFAYTRHNLPELSGSVRNLVYLRRYNS